MTTYLDSEVPYDLNVSDEVYLGAMKVIVTPHMGFVYLSPGGWAQDLWKYLGFTVPGHSVESKKRQYCKELQQAFNVTHVSDANPCIPIGHPRPMALFVRHLHSIVALQRLYEPPF